MKSFYTESRDTTGEPMPKRSIVALILPELLKYLSKINKNSNLSCNFQKYKLYLIPQRSEI